MADTATKNQIVAARKDDLSHLALVVGGSVFVFLLTFMSAHAWVVTATWLLQKKKQRYTALYITIGLTVLTFAIAYAFAFGSSSSKLRLPLDISGLLYNVGLDVQSKRDEEDAALNAAITQAVIDKYKNKQ